MSWIKKLLQIFSDSDEQETEQSGHFADRHTQHHGYQQDRVKDLEAKVTYQYPKGQFKFPLIPDQPEKASSRRVKPRRLKPSESPSKFGTGEEKRRPPKEYKEEKQFPEKQPVREEIKRTMIQPNRQPFRPTETPSPIYAFQRPKLDKKIEYELKGFDFKADAPEEHLPEKAPYSSSLPDETRYHDTAKEQESSKPEGLSSSAPLPDEGFLIENETDSTKAESDQNRSVEENGGLETNGSLRGLDEQEMSGAISSYKEEREVLTDGFPPMDVLLMDENSDVETEKSAIGEQAGDNNTELPGVSGEPEMSGSIHSNEEQEAGPSDSLPVNVISMTETQTQKFENAGDEAENNVLEEHVEEEENPGLIELKDVGPIQASSDTAATEGSTEEKDAAKEGRRHLPFNVLMLKQDKKKLQEKERKIIPLMREPEKQKNSAEGDTIETPVSNAVKEGRLSYEFPPLSLLDPPVFAEASTEWLEHQQKLLNETLHNFNVGAKVVHVTQGPAVTRFEVQPDPGVKVNKITNLSDDIKLSLAAKDIRIEAPIPGKHTIGIEVPNAVSRPVLLSEILQTEEFSKTPSPMAVALGLDIAGTPVITDLKKMPHGLIAGATGSGKSVCINTMLVSLLYKATPEEVRLLLIDPKMVELAPYNHIPHLVSPVITDVKAATASLKWAVEEMERRYELFAHAGVRDITRFNELAAEHGRLNEHLPYIVIIIDELADLMMMSPADVEEAICRIAQKARACGIHLIIATQRPSVDVITGLIKANVPTRIAFSVSSQVDSRTIIDLSGAEKLLGRGDMLFLENGSSKPYRLQGTFVSDREIDDAVAFVRKQRKPEYLFEQEDLIKKAQISETEDELFFEACYYIVEQGSASTSALQRRFKVGYSRASRLIMMMEEQGFITEARGSKPRDVLVTIEDLKAIQESHL